MTLQALCDQAAAFLQQANPAEAERLYRQVLAADPAHATANHLLGVIRSQAGHHAEALALYEQARPQTDPALWFNRGNALAALARYEEAAASHDQALARKPDFTEARDNRARALSALHDQAITAWTRRRDAPAAIAGLETLLTFDPDFAYARGELLHLKMFAADWRGLDEEKAAIDAGVRAGKRVIKPFAYQALSESPADLQACAAIVAGDLFPPQPALFTGRRQRKKIRIGYLSGEFREQATAYLAAGLYEAHDRGQFEILALDSGSSDFSPMRRRLESAFDKIIPIAQLSDADAGQEILAAEIDILVNLNGYFGAQRMGVFARRPAPIQVNYLGFPGTLGAPYMDYILADAVVIPPGEDRFYSEKVIRLPGSYQVNDSRRRIAATPSRAACGLPEHAFVFCNFNAGYKLTPEVFAVWMRLLSQVKDSVLWLQDSNPAFTENLRRHAEDRGVAANRLIFAPRLKVEDHLARLGAADLFLDTLPCNAHTTASDALWAGLPLVTCRGKAFCGRVAASLLTAINLPELVSENLEAYERLARKLAQDAPLLASIRQKLMANRLTTPLFDTKTTTRHIEQAYLEMWEQRAPEAFRV